MKTVSRNGKKDRRALKNRARKAFDKAMNSLFSGIQNLGSMHLQKAISEIPEFNIRRLAHWVDKRKKQISRDCIGWLQNTFGSLGGMKMRLHFF